MPIPENPGRQQPASRAGRTSRRRRRRRRRWRLRLWRGLLRVGRGLREALVPLVAVLLAGALLAGYSLWRRGTLPDWSAEEAGQAGVVVAGTVAVALLTRWAERRRYHRFFRELGGHVNAACANPSARHVVGCLQDNRPLGGLLLVPALRALLMCYRQALGRVVAVREEVDELRSRFGSPDNPRYTAFPFERSRQHMVGRLTPTFAWLSATPLLQQVLGRSVEQLNGRSFLHVVHSRDRERVAKVLAETLREGESHNAVFRVRPPTIRDHGAGKEERFAGRFFQMDVLAYFDAVGKPLQLRCHFIDVTERVLAERALRKRTEELVQANERLQQINHDLERLKESYRDLYHNAPVMYFSLDEQGRFAAVNESMLRKLGYGREGLAGLPYERLLTPAAREALGRDPDKLRRPGETETEWLGADGRVREVWVGTSIIRDGRGSVVRSRCAATDISERNQLARAVVGRARDLEQANEQLRRINQELEEFTYVVSHDLKEPLRTVEAFSNFLAADYGEALAGDGKEYIQHLQDASRRLGALIDDLLALSRAGRVIGTPRPLDWGAVLATVRADLQDLAARRQGATVRVEGPLPAVQGDPERVIQLLTNLVGNGLKYNASPCPEVVIGSAGSANPGGRHAILFVRDNGMGIDPAYHEQIFRIFRRLHSREQYEGTGAGLAICKKVVEAHGGRIWVESRAGRGATFYFTLPLAAGEPGADAPGG